MGPSLDWKTALGSLALLGTVALASPGVRVAAADPVAAGASCSGQGADVAQLEQLERARMRAQAQMLRDLAEEGADAAADRPVALNNRGYNYGAASGIDAAAVLRALQAR